MKWVQFIPELALLVLIVLSRQLEPSGFAHAVYGLLSGALAGAAWCSLETALGSLGLSKLKHAAWGAVGALPLVVIYSVFGADFFTAAGIDWLFFRNTSVTTQEQRDISLLAILGAMFALMAFRAFDR